MRIRTVFVLLMVVLTIIVGTVSASRRSVPSYAEKITAFDNQDAINRLGSSQSPKIVHSQSEGLPLSLEDMLGAEFVALGTVGKVLRMAHSPYVHNGPAQHTVFAFQISERLKDDSRVKGSIVKVCQHMGDLPWVDGDRRGQGLRISGQAMLVPGKEYILFLARPPLGGLPFHIAEYDGVKGKTGDGDEYNICFGGFGQIAILGRRLSPPVLEPSGQSVAWQFEKGPQLLGKNVADGTELIRRTNLVRERNEKIREALAKKEIDRQLKIPQAPLPPQEHGPVGTKPPPE